MFDILIIITHFPQDLENFEFDLRVNVINQSGRTLMSTNDFIKEDDGKFHKTSLSKKCTTEITIKGNHHSLDNKNIINKLEENVDIKINPLIKHISCGKNHFALIDFNGEYYCWGSNKIGQLGGKDLSIFEEKPVLTSIYDIYDKFYDCILKVSCGEDFTVIKTLSGEVLAWGQNNYGQCGLGHNTEVVNKPTVVDYFASNSINIIDIAAGGIRT